MCKKAGQHSLESFTAKTAQALRLEAKDYRVFVSLGPALEDKQASCQPNVKPLSDFSDAFT